MEIRNWTILEGEVLKEVNAYHTQLSTSAPCVRTEQYFFSSFKKYFNFVHRGFIKNGLLLIIFVLFEQHCATVQYLTGLKLGSLE